MSNNVALATVSTKPQPVPARAAGWRTAGFAGGAATASLAVLTSGVLGWSYAVVGASLAVVVLLALGWTALRTRLSVLRTADLYKIAVLWALPLTVARPLFSGDVWSYLAQGLTAAHGLDPYRLGPAQALGPDSAVTQHVSHYWVGTPSPYGPVWTVLSGLVGRIAGGHLVQGVLSYRLLALAGVVLIAWALPRLARRGGVSPVFSLWLGLLNPLVLWHLVAGAHNDALMLGLMLVGLELALSAATPARLAAGVTVLTGAASIKIVAAAAICCVAAEMARRHGCRSRQVLAVLVTAAASMVLFSAIGGFGWITAIRGTTTVYSWMSPSTGTGLLLGAVLGAGVTPVAVKALNIAAVLVFLPVAVRLMLDVYRGRTTALRAVGLLFAAALLCGPVIQPWYLLWALLPLAVTAYENRERTVLIAVSVAFSFLVPPLAAAASQLVAGYVVAAAVIAVVLTVVALRRRATSGRPARGHRRESSSAGPATVSGSESSARPVSLSAGMGRRVPG